MPFLEHFGLRSYPFGLTPDPKLFYPLPDAEAILAALAFAITRGDGLLKVVGEVGTGKTLLCRLLLARLEGLQVNTAYLNAPTAPQASALPHLVAREFGVEVEAGADAAYALRDYLLEEHTKGRKNVLVIDEAQALGAAGLEAVRLLSNLETETDKLLQIVLFGQAELDRLLNRRELRQILQRITFAFTTQPLPTDKVGDYIAFRLEGCRAAGAEAVRFAPEVFPSIAKASHGLPRLVHLITDKALLAAYAEGKREIERHHASAAVKETKGATKPFWRFW